MYMIYKINAEDLDSRFIRALKAFFKDKEIEIVVCESSNIEEDETAYLLKSPANKERLLKAIENVAQKHNLITIKTDELE
jgi:antitoxin YefM